MACVAQPAAGTSAKVNESAVICSSAIYVSSEAGSRGQDSQQSCMSPAGMEVGGRRGRGGTGLREAGRGRPGPCSLLLRSMLLALLRAGEVPAAGARARSITSCRVLVSAALQGLQA